MRAVGALATVALLVGCQWGVRSTFYRTDPGFRPATGATPPVYLYSADVPSVAWRSVGFIDSTVPANCGIRGAMNAAAAKGREVGCRALVEHTAFARAKLRRRRPAMFEAADVTLVHQTNFLRAVPVPPPPPSSGDSITVRFDCAVLADPETTVVVLP